MAKSSAPEKFPEGVEETRYVDGSVARLSLPVGAAGLVLVCAFAPDGSVEAEGLLEGKEKRGTWILAAPTQIDFRSYPHSGIPASRDPIADGSVWSEGRCYSDQVECGDSGLLMERVYFKNGSLRGAGFKQDGAPIGTWLMLDEQGVITTKCMSPEWRVHLRGGS
jgi:hypothetical protein